MNLQEDIPKPPLRIFVAQQIVGDFYKRFFKSGTDILHSLYELNPGAQHEYFGNPDAWLKRLEVCFKYLGEHNTFLVRRGWNNYAKSPADGGFTFEWDATWVDSD